MASESAALSPNPPAQTVSAQQIPAASEDLEVIKKRMGEVTQAMNERRQSLLLRQETFHKRIKAYYDKSLADQVKTRFSPEERTLSRQEAELRKKLGRVQKSLLETFEDEHKLLDREHDMTIEQLKQINELTKSGPRSRDEKARLAQEAEQLGQALETLESKRFAVSEEQKRLMAVGHESI